MDRICVCRMKRPEGEVPNKNIFVIDGNFLKINQNPLLQDDSNNAGQSGAMR